jgi:hypothetical protein
MQNISNVVITTIMRCAKKVIITLCNTLKIVTVLVIIQFKSKKIKSKPSGNRLDKEIQHILTK